MFEAKALSAAIRKRKRESLRPDMDYAGQEAVDPNVAFEEKQDVEVNQALGEPDHESPTDTEMGEDESSQDVEQLKKSIVRIKKYFDAL